MNDFDFDEIKDDAIQTQVIINSGFVWQLEGSAGRAAMDFINSGLCILGRSSTRDYYGNVVPSRDMVKPGTKGSIEYARELQGDWADVITNI